MIITYFTNFITPLLTGFSFHTMKPLHNYLKTNIHKRTLKNNMISSQKIITGFFHTLKLLQNDLSSKVHTKVLQIKRNHPIITGSYEHKLLTFFFISEPLHNDLNTNVSTRVLHIKCYATKKKTSCVIDK